LLEAYPTRTVILNLVGLHGSPPVSGDIPHSAPRLVPNFLKRVAGTKDALGREGSVHFIHGSDVGLAVLLVHRRGRNAVGRWIVSDGLVRDWWALALEMGTDQVKGWALELMRERGLGVLPRQKGLGRMMDGSEFWAQFGGVPGHVGLST
jgi:nucleoside-diphosphate-sugar epimerase